MMVKIKWLYANYLHPFAIWEGKWKNVSGNYHCNPSMQCADVFHNVMQVRSVTAFNGTECIAVLTRTRNSVLLQAQYGVKHRHPSFDYIW
jgi:hypothetical protein